MKSATLFRQHWLWIIREACLCLALAFAATVFIAAVVPAIVTQEKEL